MPPRQRKIKTFVIVFAVLFIIAGLIYAASKITITGSHLRVSSLQKGIVGHWVLDAESYNSNTARVTDKTPYENHGTNYGATLTADQMGQANRAMSFSGNYISISNPLDQPNLEQEWSVSAWVNIHDTGTTQFLISGLNAGVELVHASSDRILLYLNSGDHDYYVYGDQPGLLTNQGWKFVTFVFRNSDGLRKIYVDGEDHTGGGPNKDFTPSGVSSTLRIGTYANGSISDVRIYNHVLSAEEINTLYHSYRPKVASGSLQKGLILDIPLKFKYTKDETPGSEILTDRTPYSNDGQNYGAVVEADYTTFDGNDYINSGNAKALNITDALSVGAWVIFNYLDYSGGTGRLLGVAGKGYPDSANPHSGWWFNYDNRLNKNYFVYTCFGNSEGGHSGGGNNFGNVHYNFLEGVWYYLAFAVNSTEGKFYINGDLKGTTAFSNLALSDTSRDLRIGHSCVSYFNGSISDVRIYNRALSGSEIKLLFDKGRR